MLYTLSVYCIASLIACLLSLAKQWWISFIVPPKNFFTQPFVSRTCHDSTTTFWFSVYRLQTSSDNIGQIPEEQCQCYQLFSLDSPRLQNMSLFHLNATQRHIFANFFFLYAIFNAAKGRSMHRLVGVSCLALSLATSALYSFLIFMAGQVWVGCLTSTITF